MTRNGRWPLPRQRQRRGRDAQQNLISQYLIEVTRARIELIGHDHHRQFLLGLQDAKRAGALDHTVLPNQAKLSEARDLPKKTRSIVTLIAIRRLLGMVDGLMGQNYRRILLIKLPAGITQQIASGG